MSGSAPDPPPASQSSLSQSASQSSQSQSASQSSQSQPAKEERVWRLKDCTMEIGSVGKKDPKKDVYMTFDLIFQFDDDPTPKVVGELTPTRHQKLSSVIKLIFRATEQ